MDFYKFNEYIEKLDEEGKLCAIGIPDHCKNYFLDYMEKFFCKHYPSFEVNDSYIYFEGKPEDIKKSIYGCCKYFI